MWRERKTVDRVWSFLSIYQLYRLVITPQVVLCVPCKRAAVSPYLGIGAWELLKRGQNVLQCKRKPQQHTKGESSRPIVGTWFSLGTSLVRCISKQPIVDKRRHRCWYFTNGTTSSSLAALTDIGVVVMFPDSRRHAATTKITPSPRAPAHPTTAFPSWRRTPPPP